MQTSCYNKHMWKKYRFDPKKFKLGMRTLKTGIAVFLVILLFQLFGWEGTNIAALTAVFSLREDFGKSLDFGSSRILGNTIGGLYAIIYFIIDWIFPSHYLIALIFIPIVTMLTIMTNVSMDNKNGIIGSVSALLIITLSNPIGSSIQYALVRVFETFIGVFIAILVNADVDRIKAKLVKEKK